MTTSSNEQLKVESLEFRDSSRVERLEVLDTLREVTTITITKNEEGNTTFTSVVTERDKVRFESQLKDKSEKIKVVKDTVYVAVRDSVVESRNYGVTEARNRSSPVVSALKWIFWIIVALGALIVLIKVSKIF